MSLARPRLPSDPPFRRGPHVEESRLRSIAVATNLRGTTAQRRRRRAVPVVGVRGRGRPPRTGHAGIAEACGLYPSHHPVCQTLPGRPPQLKLNSAIRPPDEDAAQRLGERRHSALSFLNSPEKKTPSGRPPAEAIAFLEHRRSKPLVIILFSFFYRLCHPCPRPGFDQDGSDFVLELCGKGCLSLPLLSFSPVKSPIGLHVRK